MLQDIDDHLHHYLLLWSTRTLCESTYQQSLKPANIPNDNSCVWSNDRSLFAVADSESVHDLAAINQRFSSSLLDHSNQEQSRCKFLHVLRKLITLHSILYQLSSIITSISALSILTYVVYASPIIRSSSFEVGESALFVESPQSFMHRYQSFQEFLIGGLECLLIALLPHYDINKILPVSGSLDG